MGSGRFDGAPVTKWLLILNIAIFFLDVFEAGANSWGRLTPYGAYTIFDVFQQYEVWRMITFQFLHADMGHLLFNMMAIYFFGNMVERALGSRRFIAYYLMCGVGGALFYTLLVWVGWLSPGILVGASAGIFGIIVALIIIAPDMRVMLILPPIPMKMKTLGIVVLGIGVFTVLTSGKNAGGEAGHLGGALAGFLLMKYYALKTASTGVGFGRRRTAVESREYVPKIRPRTVISLDSSEVDRILDKVSEHGLHSLTNEERATLKALSERD